VFPVRKLVKERKNWAKFGDVKGIARGEHKTGDWTVGEPIEI